MIRASPLLREWARLGITGLGATTTRNAPTPKHSIMREEVTVTENDYEDSEQKGVSRRTVTKAMAWAVPAIAVATAAPAFAASPTCVTIELGPEACKVPGQSEEQTPWFYHLQVCFMNTCTSGGDIEVVIDGAVTVSGVVVPNFGGTFQLSPGEEVCLTSDFCSTNSAGAILISGTIGGVPIDNQGGNSPGRIPAGPNDLDDCTEAGACP